MFALIRSFRLSWLPERPLPSLSDPARIQPPGLLDFRYRSLPPVYQGFVHPLGTARDHCHGFPLIFRMRGRVRSCSRDRNNEKNERRVRIRRPFGSRLGSFSGISLKFRRTDGYIWEDCLRLDEYWNNEKSGWRVWERVMFISSLKFGYMGISKYRLCLDQYIWKKNDHFLTEISDTRRSDGCMSCWS